MTVSQITAWEGGVDGEDEGLAGQVAWTQTNICLVFQLKREEKSVFLGRESVYGGWEFWREPVSRPASRSNLIWTYSSFFVE